MRRYGLSLFLCAALLAVQARVDTEALEARVTRIETRTLVELLTRLERLQSEVQQLRGMLEEQGHTLEGAQKSQRDQYLDIDSRLQKLEGGAPADAGSTPPPVLGETPPPSPVAPVPDASTPPVAAPPADVPPADPADEQGAYQAAFNLLKDKRYNEAGAAFGAYIANYPDGRYADNAQYWLAETRYVERDYPAALVEFTNLVERFPQSTKQPDAKLKIGYIYYSSAARLADERLRRMGQEGR
jgi:tol-pal system protein YbgF